MALSQVACTCAARFKYEEAQDRRDFAALSSSKVQTAIVCRSDDNYTLTVKIEQEIMMLPGPTRQQQASKTVSELCHLLADWSKLLFD